MTKIFDEEFIAEICPELEVEEVEETIYEEDITGKMQALYNYGPFQKDKWYKVIKEYPYYYAVKLKGQNLNVFKWVFNT